MTWRRPLTKEERQRVIDMRRAGATCVAIAAAIGCDRVTVFSILKPREPHSRQPKLAFPKSARAWSPREIEVLRELADNSPKIWRKCSRDPSAR